jgi:hypothetical protein
MSCTLRFAFNKDHEETILSAGRLSSNKALREGGNNFAGGTSSAQGNDEMEFGNTGFVFTNPFFHPPGQPRDVYRGNECYMPGTHLVRGGDAWLSFHDWLDYLGRTHDYEPYLGNERANPASHPARRSVACDFYYGDDIPEAVALKTFEALKTVILMNRDDSEHGFDLDKASGILGRMGRARDMFPNGNGLDVPVESLELSEPQLRFLVEKSPERDALVAAAVNGVILTMHKQAEMKVPGFISLDGAAMTHEDYNFDTREYTRAVIHCTSQPNTTPEVNVHFGNGPSETKHHAVPKDPRDHTLPQIQTCPD